MNRGAQPAQIEHSPISAATFLCALASGECTGVAQTNVTYAGGTTHIHYDLAGRRLAETDAGGAGELWLCFGVGTAEN